MGIGRAKARLWPAVRSLLPVHEIKPMSSNRICFFATLGVVFVFGLGGVLPLTAALAQTEVIINQPGSPAVLIDGNKIMDAKPATATKPRKPAAPAPADSYTSRGGVPQSSTEETHMSNGLVCKTEKGQRTCR